MKSNTMELEYYYLVFWQNPRNTAGENSLLVKLQIFIGLNVTEN